MEAYLLRGVLEPGGRSRASDISKAGQADDFSERILDIISRTNHLLDRVAQRRRAVGVYAAESERVGSEESGDDVAVPAAIDSSSGRDGKVPGEDAALRRSLLGGGGVFSPPSIAIASLAMHANDPP